MSSERYKVADESEFARDGDRVITDVAGIEVAVFKIDDEYRALANFCPHQSGPLCEGKVLGELRGSSDGWQLEYDGSSNVIACPWHGWRFKIDSGESLETDQYSVPKFDVVVEGGEVFVVR